MDQRRRLKKLIERNPRCHWCGTVVEHNPVGGKLEDHHATIDHLYTRCDPRRWEYPNNKERTVLACNACNRRRDLESRDQYRALKAQGIDPYAHVDKEALIRAIMSMPVDNRPSQKRLYKFGVTLWPDAPSAESK